MEEIISEQTEKITHTAEAEEGVKAEKSEVSLGKFKDADALIKAYNSLQAEFTKRCQRLKELEGIMEAKEKASNKESAEKDGKSITEEEKQEILKGYLKNVLDAKQKAIVMDGAGYFMKTPESRPKTLAEAGEYAKQIFNNK